MLKKSLKKIIATTLIAFTVALPAINVLDGQTASASSSRAEYDPYYTGGNYNPYYTENYNVIKFQNGASLENNRYEYVFKYSSRAAEKEGYFILSYATQWAHIPETIYLEKSFPNVVNGTRTSQTNGNKTLTRKNGYLYLTIDANKCNYDALNVNIRFFTNYGQRYRNTNTGMNSPYEGAGYTLYRK